MVNFLPRVAVLATLFLVGCAGSAPAPAAKGAGAKASAPTNAKDDNKADKKPDAFTRADEIIADLQKRQAGQDSINQANRDAVPVVVEVTPKGGPKGRGGFAARGGGVGYNRPDPPPMPPPGAGNDADYWRQEFGIAQAALKSAEQRLDLARTTLNDASSQINNPNLALKKMGEDRMARARQEYDTAQSEVSQLQMQLSRVREAAIAAGVPPNVLR